MTLCLQTSFLQENTDFRRHKHMRYIEFFQLVRQGGALFPETQPPVYNDQSLSFQKAGPALKLQIPVFVSQ